MTEIDIDINGLDRAIQKMSKFPEKMKAEMNRNMHASLDVLNENVPAYPPKPESSKYIRTGTLGKSIGSSMAGGKTGTKPTVYSVTGTGGNIQGRFGTNLSYAKYVIDSKQQAYMHRGRWWTLDNVKENAKSKIMKIWQDMVNFVLRRS